PLAGASLTYGRERVRNRGAGRRLGVTNLNALADGRAFEQRLSGRERKRRGVCDGGREQARQHVVLLEDLVRGVRVVVVQPAGAILGLSRVSVLTVGGAEE